MTHVFLHIGAFKTGTSFVQGVLDGNKALLADHGLLFPGKSWSDQTRAVNGLRGLGAGMDDWNGLVAEIDQWSGRGVVISMEFLSFLNPRRVKAALASLRRHDVTVVLSARDLVRAVPAQWQESVQNGHTWTYHTYVEGVTGRQSAVNRAGTHFWRRQDWPAILRTWGDTLPRDQLVLITVPPAGGAPSLLWERFCSVLEVPPDAFDTSKRTNESLGAASAEVMRLVTDRALARGPIDDQEHLVLKKILAKSVLAGHKSAEPTLVLPPEQFEWAVGRSRQLVEQLRAVAPVVVGDLDELMPAPPATGPGTTTDPQLLSCEATLEAAVVGLTGLTRALARAQESPVEGKPSRRGRRQRRLGDAPSTGPDRSRSSASEDAEEPIG